MARVARWTLAATAAFAVATFGTTYWYETRYLPNIAGES